MSEEQGGARGRGDEGVDAGAARRAEASGWFARMRGPDAEPSREAFAAWLAEPANAEVYREFEAVWSLAGRTAPRGARAGGARCARHWTKLALIAAAVIGSVMLGYRLVGGYRPQPDADRRIAYAAPLGEIRAVALADGSRVTLDTQTRIDVRMTATTREIVLDSGRARFAVAKDATRPFAVLVRGRAVVATGTLFDVRIDGTVVSVDLIEGGVDLERRGSGAAPVRLARLRPGQRAVLAASGAPVRIAANPPSAASWTAGLLPAEGLPLAEVVAEANRYGLRKIVLADPALGRLAVSGAFRPSNTEALAASLASALDLSVARRADGAIVLSRRSSVSSVSAAVPKIN